MQSIKEYKAKLHTFSNIEKMTRTMKLVSASKLRQAHQAESVARQYARELTALISRLSASVESASHPLLNPKEKVKNVLVVVLTSDKGLCGGFNNNLNKQVRNWIKVHTDTYEKIDLSFCGKRGRLFFKNYENVKKYYEGVVAKPDFAHAHQIGDELCTDYVTDVYDEVYLAYNRFHNPLLQTPNFEKILPIDPHSLLEGGAPLPADYIFEPKKIHLLKFLIPRFLYFKVFYALLENSAGEHGARTTAMDKASQNAQDLIDEYTLLRNRARQAAITKELIEIVSGAESLK